MTHDEILNLQANPETDALIAEKVMKLKVINGYVFERRMIPCPDNRPGCLVIHYGAIPIPIKSYTKDISAAWEVVEKFAHKASNKLAREQGFSYWQINAYPDSGWTCRIGSESVYAETAPLAICRASLLVILGEQQNDC